MATPTGQIVNREPINDGVVGLKFTNNINNAYKGSGEPLATAYGWVDPDPIPGDDDGE